MRRHQSLDEITSPYPLVRLLYQVQYEMTSASDRLLLSGSVGALGRWQLNRAIPLLQSPSNPSIWKCAVDAPSIDFEYAYVLVRRDQMTAAPVWFPKRVIRLTDESTPVVCITDGIDLNGAPISVPITSSNPLTTRLSLLESRLARVGEQIGAKKGTIAQTLLMEEVQHDIADLRQHFQVAAAAAAPAPAASIHLRAAILHSSDSVDHLRQTFSTLRDDALLVSSSLDIEFDQLRAVILAHDAKPPPTPTLSADLCAAIIESSTTVQLLRESFSALRNEALLIASLFDFDTLRGIVVSRAASDRAERLRLTDEYEKECSARRALLDRYHSLRGKIRVLIRVRPQLATEVERECAIEVLDDSSLSLFGKIFAFDGVLGPFSQQGDVFGEVRDVVESCVDGFTCSVFSYGATNSGKTYSMEGPRDDRGVSYRSLEHLFDVRDDRRATTVITIRLSIVEIYNDALFDLLLPADQQRPALEIVNAAEDEGRVSNLTWLTIESAAGAWSMIEAAMVNRSVGATRANAHSSRSHLVVCLAVRSEDRRSGSILHGKLALIDLAGSERLAVTGSTGERLRESQAINKSLSALSGVFRALSEGDPHIPFRDSRLTFLLQDYLNLSARVVSIVHVSPCSGPVADESLCSLRFAQRVKRVDLGPAVRRAESGEYLKYKTASANKDRQIDELRAEIAMLRTRQASMMSPRRRSGKQSASDENRSLPVNARPAISASPRPI